MANEQDILINEKLNTLLAKQVEFEKTRARLAGESVSNLEQEQALLARREQYSRELTIILNEDEDRRERSLAAMKKDIDAELRKGQIVAEVAQQRKKDLDDLNRALENGDKKEIERQKKKLKAIEAENKEREKTIASIRAAGRAAEGLVDTMGNLVGISRDSGSTFRDVAKAIKGGKKSMAEFGSVAAKALGGRFGLAAVGGMVANNQLQVTVGFNQLRAQVLGATGANKDLTKTIENSSRAFKAQGVSFADAGGAAMGLYTNFSRFSTLNKDSQRDVIGMTSMLQNLGVSAATTGENFNFLVSEIGMELPQASAAIRDMTEVGASMGIAPQEMNQAFAALSPRLAEFGARAPAIFGKTAVMAKKLGINIQDMGGTLFSLSDKLSTFEGSADLVATLSTVLGGSFVNAFDLTMAMEEGPDAQLELIRQGMKAAGKEFDDFGFHAQRKLAKGFNLEVGKVRAILGDGADAATIFTGEQKKLETMSTNATDSLKDQKLVFENLTKAVDEAAKKMKSFSESAVKMSSSDPDGGMGGLEMLLAASFGVDLLRLGGKGLGKLKGAKGLGAAAGRHFKNPFASKKVPTPTPSSRRGGPTAPRNVPRRRFIPKPPAPSAAAQASKVLPKAAAAGTNLGRMGLATAGKLGSKLIPGIGAAVSLGMAGKYLMDGDFLGAGLEGISAGLSFVPGIGTAGALGIQGILAARSMGAFDSESPTAAPAMTPPPRTASTTSGITPQQIETAMTRALHSAKRHEKPIKVELYMDSAGRNKIAQATVNYIDRNYSTSGNARVPSTSVGG